jgi:hypothetical protein
MNSDGVGAFALLFDYEPARAFLLREAEIAYRWLAREDYAARMWVRNGWSDGDFRPAERRFKQTRWAAMLGLPQTVPLSWEETYYAGMRGLDAAEQWVADGAGVRYTHKSVGRYDPVTNMGPTPDFMLGLLGTEVTVSAVETFGSRMPVTLRAMADRRLDEICTFLATQFHPSRRELPAVRYYSDEIPGELKPWHETITDEDKKRWPAPAVNLNDYYTLLFAAAGARLNAPYYTERALLLWDGLAGDYLDGHGGPYMGEYTSVQLKVYNQARLNCDRSVAYLPAV